MKGILLVNLGTPDSPAKRDVFKYLIEFLTDGRVIDISWLKRQLLVRGIIVPFRYKESAKNYQAVWTEKGSPLLLHTATLRDKVQELAGEGAQVEMAMRYQNPSLESGLEKLKHCDKITIIPLFPQYASATTGSIHEKVMQIVQRWEAIPELSFVNNFYKHPLLIQAFEEQAKRFDITKYDHILFSFHGLPVRQLVKCHVFCQSKLDCCDTLQENNKNCYAAQCHQTAKLIAEQLGLKNYYITFQSRLGKDPWIEPYTIDVIKKLADEGAKKLLVFCPAFVSDCLETIHEIGVEYAHEFKLKGGEKLDLVPSLNGSDTFAELILELSQK